MNVLNETSGNMCPSWKLFMCLSEMINGTTSIYHDVKLICRDGCVFWSKFLLASNSPFLKKLLLSSTSEDNETIIIPDISISAVSCMLMCTLNHAVRNDLLSVNELEVISVLGFAFSQQHVLFHGSNNCIPSYKEFLANSTSEQYNMSSSLVLHDRFTNSTQLDLNDIFCSDESDIIYLSMTPTQAENTTAEFEIQADINASDASLLPTVLTSDSSEVVIYSNEQNKHPQSHNNVIHEMIVEQSAFSQSLGSSEPTGSDQMPVDSSRIPCGICLKTFSTISNATFHRRKFHRRTNGKLAFIEKDLPKINSDKRLECSVCGKTFSVVFSWQRHMRNVHQPIRLKCPNCGTLVKHLSSHLISVHGVAPKEAKVITAKTSEKLYDLCLKDV